MHMIATTLLIFRDIIVFCTKNNVMNTNKMFIETNKYIHTSGNIVLRKAIRLIGKITGRNRSS